VEPDSAVSYPAASSLVTQEWAASVRQLVVERPRFGNKVIGRRGIILFHNRNEITKLFLETGREWLLMTDVDIVFEVADVDALYDAAERHGPGIYSGVVMTLGNKGIKPIFGYWLPEQQTCKFWDEPPPADADDEPIMIVPTAFLLVHRDVFTGIGDDGWFNHVATTDGEGRMLGEDIAFCLRALDKGFPIYLVPGSRPGHVKTGVFYPDARPQEEE